MDAFGMKPLKMGQGIVGPCDGRSRMKPLGMRAQFGCRLCSMNAKSPGGQCRRIAARSSTDIQGTAAAREELQERSIEILECDALV